MPFSSIVALTGAGLSAESGVSTFRDPNGIWAKFDYRDVATFEGFARNPQMVHDFYNMRRNAHHGIKPNAAHYALARLEAEHRGVTIVTQNIDALHEAAGSKSLLHMHGEIFKSLCGQCGTRQPSHQDLSPLTVCGICKQSGFVRPDVVWFGETPYHLDEIQERISSCDLFISIGTSGNVYPAADFVRHANQSGAHSVELNLEPSVGAPHFAESVYGPATVVVPAYVERILSRNL